MAKAKVSAKKLKEIEAAEQKFRPLDTPASPYPFPNLGMEKPASKKKTTKAKPKKKQIITFCPRFSCYP